MVWYDGMLVCIYCIVVSQHSDAVESEGWGRGDTPTAFVHMWRLLSLADSGAERAVVVWGDEATKRGTASKQATSTTTPQTTLWGARLGICSLVFHANRSFVDQKERSELSLFFKKGFALFALVLCSCFNFKKSESLSFYKSINKYTCLSPKSTKRSKAHSKKERICLS